MSPLIKPILPTEEMYIIEKIARRANALLGKQRSMMDIMMDITYCHKVLPLDLNKLLCFSNFDLLHDVVGIAEHIDHNTLTMSNRFLPRCALDQ